MGQARAKTWFGLAGLAKQELSQLIPVYFRNRPKRSQKIPKVCICICFSRLDFWIVIYQPSVTLFKFNDFSNQCPQLAWGPEDQVAPPRRNEIYQIDTNWTKPKKRETLAYRDDFPPFWFLELFGSRTSQSLLEYVGISHWLQVSDRRGHGVLFFTACLQRKVRALQLSSSIVFNYYGHVWSQLSCHAIYCHLFMWDVCFITKNVRTTAMHFVEWLRSVRLVWDHGWLSLRLWEANGRKRCVAFDAVRSSTF